MQLISRPIITAYITVPLPPRQRKGNCGLPNGKSPKFMKIPVVQLKTISRKHAADSIIPS